MIADPHGWIGFVPASLTFGCLLTGFIGGMGMYWVADFSAAVAASTAAIR